MQMSADAVVHEHDGACGTFFVCQDEACQLRATRWKTKERSVQSRAQVIIETHSKTLGLVKICRITFVIRLFFFFFGNVDF